MNVLLNRWNSDVLIDRQKAIDYNIVSIYHEKLKADIIKAVLKDLLKRDIVDDDGKDVTIAYDYNVIDRFKIIYQNKLLGEVKEDWDFKDASCIMRFQPSQEFK